MDASIIVYCYHFQCFLGKGHYLFDFGPKGGWGDADLSFEAVVELAKGAEADFQGNIEGRPVGGAEVLFGGLEAQGGDVFDQAAAGFFAEESVKAAAAQAGPFGHGLNRDVLVVVQAAKT